MAKKILYGLLIIALVFGMLFLGCNGDPIIDDPPPEDEPGTEDPLPDDDPIIEDPFTGDTALNGTWVDCIHNSNIVWVYNNGFFEFSMKGSIPPYDQLVKLLIGTYTTTNGKIPMIPTYIYGPHLNSILDSEWYSIDEAIATVKDLLGLTDEGVDEYSSAFKQLEHWYYLIADETLALFQYLEGEFYLYNTFYKIN